MKSIVKIAVVACLMMVLLLAAGSVSAQQQQQEESPLPSVFLGNLLTDLKSLGLIKSTSVQKRTFDKKEMKVAITHLARMVRYLLLLKGQGRDGEVTNWVESLKNSKKFYRTVRMVRKLMRKIAKDEQANGPKFVLPIKGVVQTVMKKALVEMKSLLEQSAGAARQEAVAITTPKQQQPRARPVRRQPKQQQPALPKARPEPRVVRQQPKQPIVAQKPAAPVNPAQQAWAAVEKMAHKMVKVTKPAVPQQPTSSDNDDEANPEEAHLVWEAVERIAHKMAEVASEPEVNEPTADVAQG